MSSAGIGRTGFVCGVALMLLSVFVGREVQPQLEVLGLSGYQALHSGLDSIVFFAFVLGFPIGLCVALAGVVLAGGAGRRRAGLFLLLAVPSVAVVTVYPSMVGKHLSPSYFGIGGMCILVLVSIVIWSWGRLRSGYSGARRTACDLQVVGYLCFALATWNVCGFASVPALALYPEKVIALGTGEFAVGHLKAVMALFVTGWLFTAIGIQYAIRARK